MRCRVVPNETPSGRILVNRIFGIGAELRSLFGGAVSAANRAAGAAPLEPGEPLGGERPFVAARAASHPAETLEVDGSLDHRFTFA